MRALTCMACIWKELNGTHSGFWGVCFMGLDLKSLAPELPIMFKLRTREMPVKWILGGIALMLLG